WSCETSFLLRVTPMLSERAKQVKPPIASGAFVPKSLPDQLVRALQQGRRHRQPDDLRRLEVDHQLELRRLLHGTIGRLSTLQDLAPIGGGAVEHRANARPVRHEATQVDVLPRWKNGR